MTKCPFPFLLWPHVVPTARAVSMCDCESEGWEGVSVCLCVCVCVCVYVLTHTVLVPKG